jgi:putative ABC transport system permease protein
MHGFRVTAGRTFWMDTLLSQLQSAARTLWRNPRFTLTALAVLSLGVGTVSALFSVVDKVLLEPLPYPDPDRLVQLITSTSIGNQSLASIPKFLLWRDNTTSFEWMAASDIHVPEINFTNGGYRHALKAARVSADYFHVFGAQIATGRTFSSHEDGPDGSKVVVISDRLFRGYFRSDSSLIGRAILLDDVPYQVVGVLAPDIHLESPADLWLPLRADPHSVDYIGRVRVVARLRAAISLEQAQIDLSGVADRSREWGLRIANSGDTFTTGFSTAIPLRDAIVGDVRPSLYVLMGAGSFVLAISCLNMATLLLMRFSRRTREIAVRMAMGAARKQIVIELLTESVLFSLMGGTGGFVFGYLGVREVLAISPEGLPRVGSNGSGIALDWRILLFALSVSIFIGILCALTPALNASRTAINVLVKDSSSHSGMTLRRNRWRPALVVMEMSFSLVLLVGAGLLIRTFVAERAVNRGFDEQNVVTLNMSLNNPRFDNTTEVAQLVRYAERRVKAVPGVEAIATTNALPLISSLQMPFHIFEQHEHIYGRYDGTATWRSVSPEYFKVFQIRLLRGRMFTDEDDEDAAKVVLINRAMMKRYWPDINANPLGDFIEIGKGLEPGSGDPPRQIVGIVVDIRDAGLDREPSVYVPVAQISDWMNARNNGIQPIIWTIRTDKSQPSPVVRIQEELASVSSGQPLGQPGTMHEAVAASSARTEFYLTVLTLFGGMALLLAATGLYSLVAYSVQQRGRELAIRSALGATPIEVQTMVVTQALRLALCGAGAGIPLALALARITISLVFGIQAWDPIMLVLVTLLLCAVSLFAAYVPSIRASHVDPAAVLRFDT